MPWPEFVKWYWKFQQKPFGELAEDLRFVDVLLFWGNTKRKKGTRPKPLVYFIKRVVRSISGNSTETVEEMGERLRNAK